MRCYPLFIYNPLKTIIVSKGDALINSKNWRQMWTRKNCDRSMGADKVKTDTGGRLMQNTVGWLMPIRLSWSAFGKWREQIPLLIEHR